MMLWLGDTWTLLLFDSIHLVVHSRPLDKDEIQRTISYNTPAELHVNDADAHPLANKHDSGVPLALKPHKLKLTLQGIANLPSYDDHPPVRCFCTAYCTRYKCTLSLCLRFWS